MEAPLNWNRAASSAEPAPGVREALLAGLLAVDPARGAAGREDLRLETRQLAARLFDWPDSRGVIFTSGATFGLNQAVHAIPDGARVWASALEHNAVLRPLEAARQAGRLEVEILPVGEDGRLRTATLEQAAARTAGPERWLFLSWASNSLGVIQPLDELAAWCMQHEVRLVLDLSQGGGQLPARLSRWQPRFAAVAGHKGLHAVPGIGLLFVDPRHPVPPLVHGGTGTQSDSTRMPTELPGALEAGTPNWPGIHALHAALRWRLEHPAQLDQARAALARVDEQLRADARLQLLPPTPPAWEERLPVLSLASPLVPPALLAASLAQDGIHTRAGRLCAAHATSPYPEAAAGGVLRLSPPENCTLDEADRVVAALRRALDQFAPGPA